MRSKALLLIAFTLASHTPPHAIAGNLFELPKIPLPAELFSKVDKEIAELVIEKAHQQQKAIAGEKERIRRTPSLPPEEKAKIVRDLNKSSRNLSEAESAVTNTTPRSLESLTVTSETIRSLRYPVWTVCAGQPWRRTDQRSWDIYVDPVLNQLAQIAPKVGMFIQYKVLPNGALQWLHNGATAFALGGPYILTNRHVVTAYAEKGADGKWHLLQNQLLMVHFPEEYPKCALPHKALKAKVLGIELVGEEEEEDYAVLKIDYNFSPTPLGDSNEVVGGVRLITIGYPLKPHSCDGSTPTDENPCTWLTETQINMLFQVPNTKMPPFPAERMSPGTVLFNPISSPKHFSYDASTWGGSSGSPVVSLVDGKIIGLHFQGLNGSRENSGYNNALRIETIKPALEARGLIQKD